MSINENQAQDALSHQSQYSTEKHWHTFLLGKTEKLTK